MARKKQESAVPAISRLDKIQQLFAQIAELQAIVDQQDALIAEAKALAAEEVAENGMNDVIANCGLVFSKRTEVFYDSGEAAAWAKEHPEYLTLNRVKFEADAKAKLLAFTNYELGSKPTFAYYPKKNSFAKK